MIVPFQCVSCGKGVEGQRNADTGTAVCPECGKANAVPLELKPGVVVGTGYRIDRSLSETKAGEVFIAYQIAMQREVMLKTLAPSMVYDEEQFGRFIQEAKLTGSLRHPNILGAIDAGADGGIYYMVTEYRPGENLQERLKKQGGKLDEKEALRILMPIAEALQHAWTEKKILHRNVKPDNILITDDGVPMLMDLGIAKSLEGESLNLTGADYTVGTPEFMSPEQVEGDRDMDYRTDLYSLGVVLYLAVTGELPFFDINPVALMTKQLEEDPTPACEKNPDVSKRCSALIDNMLKKEREQRPGSWQELIDQMRAVAAGKTPAVSGGGGKQKKVVSTKKKPAPQGKKATSRPSGGAAGGRISRKDVEQIASVVAAKPSLGTKLLLYVLIVLVPVLLIALIYIVKQTQSSRTNAPTQTVAPRPTAARPKQVESAAPAPAVTAKPAVPSTGAAGTAKEKEMYEYAMSYRTQNPEDYDGSIQKFRAIEKQLKGTKYALMASDAVARIEADKGAAMKAVVEQLRGDAQELAGAGHYDDALKLVRSYSGALAEETAIARQALAVKLEGLRSKQAQAQREEAAQVKTEVETLTAQAAAALLKGRAPLVLKLIQQAAAEPHLVAERPVLLKLAALVDSAAKLDDVVLNGVNASAGQALKVRLAERGTLEVEIVGAEKGAITANRVIKDGAGHVKGRMAVRFTVDDLHPRDKIEFIKKAASPHENLLCGLVAYSAKNKDVAASYFRKCDPPLADLLVAEVFK